MRFIQFGNGFQTVFTIKPKQIIIGMILKIKHLKKIMHKNLKGD